MDRSSLIFLALLIGGFYFLMIRPQQRRLRQHRDLVASLRPGDEILTLGGIFGHIRRLDDWAIWIEVAEGTVVKLSRQAVRSKVGPNDAEGDHTEEERPEEDAGAGPSQEG
ncbi:MAG: preprotein translocase subunit YajC [Candidatus Methylomirabilales bacterium]